MVSKSLVNDDQNNAASQQIELPATIFYNGVATSCHDGMCYINGVPMEYTK